MKFPNSKWTVLSLMTAVLAVASALGTGPLFEAQPDRPPRLSLLAGHQKSFETVKA
jgi:hypothetical protein